MRIHEIGFFSRVGGTGDGAGSTQIPGFGSSILHFEKSSNMAKNEENQSSTCAFTLFFLGTSKTQVSGAYSITSFKYYFI